MDMHSKRYMIVDCKLSPIRSKKKMKFCNYEYAALVTQIFKLCYKPPPFLKQMYGNLQMFPRPTRHPTEENRNSHQFFQFPRCTSPELGDILLR